MEEEMRKPPFRYQRYRQISRLHEARAWILDNLTQSPYLPPEPCSILAERATSGSLRFFSSFLSLFLFMVLLSSSAARVLMSVLLSPLSKVPSTLRALASHHQTQIPSTAASILCVCLPALSLPLFLHQPHPLPTTPLP